MSRGQIVEWHFSTTFNQGVIAGCSNDVRGLFFGFRLSNLADQGLRDMLTNTPNFDRQVNCNEGPGPRWVFFSPNGSTASNISRIFTP
jgi:hypothetical protein